MNKYFWYSVVLLLLTITCACEPGRIKSPPENPPPSDQPADVPETNNQIPDMQPPNIQPPADPIPDEPAPSGITFWAGCGLSIDAIDKTDSCKFNESVKCPCPNAAQFYGTITDSATKCKTAGKVFAMWVANDPSTPGFTKDTAKTWVALVKGTVDFLKTSGWDKDTIEACLKKLVAASATIETYLQ